METRHDEEIHSLAQAVLTGPGDTELDLRRAIEASTATMAGASRDVATELPSELVSFVEKVGRNAYKITDQDIAKLRREGYSEDAIFEVTLSAALGAGLGRLQQGLAALQGSEE